ncbi:MAG: response regulator [Candidatus Omnitrophica bacterium]|nr:response regulator [Candidatus Omnitrophota bacterium]
MSNAKKILVIDDEIDLQQLIKMTLKYKGYDVLTANNGLEGLAALETLRPDLIILDMNMPKMGGVEFYQRICNKLGQPQYPVLVLTARANMEQLFREFNIDGFMAKPFEIDDLLKEVEMIIAKRSAENERVKPLLAGGPKKICIIENDRNVLNNIGSVFLSDGFVVNPAGSGTEGIEKVFNNIPDIALVKLSLPDISGDMVILKLKMMAKTQDVKCILYTEKGIVSGTIAQKISEKKGIDCFVDLNAPQDLLDVVNELLKQTP